MESMLEALAAVLSEDGWPYTQDGDRPIFRMEFKGDNGQWRCVARTRDEFGQLMFFSIFPMFIPADKRGAVAELITRANYGMVIGNFDLDLDDGELRFKTTMMIGSAGVVDQDIVRRTIYTNVLVMDNYFPAMAKVIYVGAAPLDALQDVTRSFE